jgi:DNA-binding response OmpR family regulator/chromosome segregation ATPase
MSQRLLLVDSDRGFLKEHQVSLESAFELEVVASPEGVLQRLETGAFAAVLICVEVSDNKGYALCSAIRKHPGLEGVKIALISSKATEEEYRRHQSLKGRADLYLNKPMAPSALVAALAPLVPGRTVDPDNPLGELVDTELGDDWLDSLRGVLDAPQAEAPSAPVFEVRPPSPHQTARFDSVPTAADSGRLQVLEEQVAALHEELRAKDQRLLAAEDEAQRIQRQLNSVTLNLDEMERSSREAEALKARLADTEAALKALEESKGREGETAEGLKNQLKAALVERTELIQQVETLNHQVGEKAQRAIELLKERDRLLHETMDLEPFRDKAQALEQDLLASQRALEASREAQEQALAARDQEHQQALAATQEAHKQALALCHQDLEEARLVQEQLNATLEGLVAQQAMLEGVHQAALLELAGTKERAQGLQLELAGLEATMRGQGRDLAELGGRLGQREAELEASLARLQERDQQVAAQEALLAQHAEEIRNLGEQLQVLQQHLDEAEIQHEGERLELMNGLDQKEAELLRHEEMLQELKQANGVLEEQKAALLGQLSGHQERLATLDGVLQAIQEQLRRGSELTQGSGLFSE